MSRRAARCTQADIHRALRAMTQAGVKGAVEVTADGVLRIVPTDPQATPKPEIAPERDIVL